MPDSTPSAPDTAAVRARYRMTYRLIAVVVPLLAGVLFVWWWMNRPIYVNEKGHKVSGHRYLYDEYLGWRNIPNWEATTFGKPLKINSLGLRDDEHTFEKAPGTRRLLVLGDSYAWGYGVGNDETFSAVLEKRLRGWEVINTAVSGWGTDQQLLYFESEGRRYGADVVVVAFFLGNDPANNSAASQYGLNKPVFLNKALKLGNSPVPRPRKKPLALPPKDHDQQLEITIAILKRLDEVCKREGAKLVVMKFGAFLYEGKPVFQRFEANFERRLQQSLGHVPYLDLDEAFATSLPSTETILVGNDDGHWNAKGHDFAATTLRAFLFRQQFMRGIDPR